jgi:hypothetical protein
MHAMARRRWRDIAVLAALLGVLAWSGVASAQVAWQKVAGRNGAFTAQFPGKPAVSTQATSFGASGDAEEHKYDVTAAPFGTFSVSLTVYTGGMAAKMKGITPEEFYHRATQTFLQRYVVMVQRGVVVGGQSGMEWFLRESGNGGAQASRRVRLFKIGAASVEQSMAFGPAGPDSAPAATFFASLKLGR